MSKFKRSLALFKCSLQVVRENRKLLLFPIILYILTCIIALFFIVPLAFWNTGHVFTEAAHWKALAGHLATWSEGPGKAKMHISMAGYGLLASIYLISVFMATFFNVAFFNEILNALNGQPVSIRGGLRFAVTRLKAIIAWSLLTGVVGLIIKSLEERVGWIGRWIVRLIGIAWSVAAVFAIPVIVREEKHTNPVLFLKTSASILGRTWGESLAGYVGIQFAESLILVGSVILFAIATLLSYWLGNFWILAVVAVAWFVALVLFSILLRVLSQVYRAALYIFATEGVVPGPFEPGQMDMAWKVMSGRKAR